MPQIQYPAYTNPPAFTLPTIPQLGWHAFYPDDQVREQWIRPYRALYTPSLAYDFNPENWAIPGRTIGKFYAAENPHGIPRRLQAAAMPWNVQNVQPLPNPQPQVYMVLPDDPRLGRTRMSFAHYPSEFETLALENLPPVLMASAAYPDTTRRNMLQTSDYPATGFETLTPEIFPPKLLWSATYPDRTLAKVLPTAQHPSSFRGQAPELYPPTLKWGVMAPDRVPIATPQTRIDGFSFGLQAITVVVPALSWKPTYPDRAVAKVLPTAAMPSAFKLQSLEKFAPTLQWGAMNPQTTRRATLHVSQYPSFFGGPIQIVSVGLVRITWYGRAGARRQMPTSQW